MLACQNGQLHCYGNQSNAAAHLCHHKSFSLSPFVVTLIHWVLQGGGRRGGVASLLLLLKKPLVHFRKGSERPKDSDKVNSNHGDFVLVSTRKKSKNRNYKKHKKRNSPEEFQKKTRKACYITQQPSAQSKKYREREIWERSAEVRNGQESAKKEVNWRKHWECAKRIRGKWNLEIYLKAFIFGTRY